MADNVRELTVQVSLTDNISANLKSIAGQIKETEAKFKAAGSSVDAYGNRQAQAQAKVSMLQQKLQLQKTAVEQHKAALDKAQQSYAGATAKQEELRAKLEQAKEAYGDNSEEVKKLQGQLTAADKAVQRAANQVTRASTQLHEAEAAVNATARELEDANQELSVASSRWTAFSESMSQVSERLGKIGSTMSSVGSTLTKTVTTTVVAAATAAVKTFASYDDALKQVQATMGLVSGASAEADEQIALLDRTAQEMGIATRYSASEAASALNYLALAGYDAYKACDALPLVLQLAQAGGMDLASASDMATDAMAALGLSTDQLNTFIDQMAVTSQKSNTSVAQLGEGILTVGGTAKALAGGTQELNTALGVLANRGIKGAEGGTHLRNVILTLTAGTDQAKKAIADLGVQILDAEGNMRPLDDILGQFNAKLSGLTEAQKTDILNQIFNKTDLAAVSGLLAGVGEEWDSLMHNIDGSSGAAKQMADTMESGIGGAFRSLGSAVEGLSISFGAELVPYVQKAAEFITNLTREFATLDSEEKQQIVRIAGIAAAAGPALAIGGKIVSVIGSIAGALSKVGAALAHGGAVAGFLGKLKGMATVVASPYLAIPAAITAASVVGLDALAKWGDTSQDAANKLKNLNVSVSETAVRGVTRKLVTAAADAEAQISGAIETAVEEAKPAVSDINLSQAAKSGVISEVKSAVQSGAAQAHGEANVKVDLDPAGTATAENVDKRLQIDMPRQVTVNADDVDEVKVKAASLTETAKAKITTDVEDAAKDAEPKIGSVTVPKASIGEQILDAAAKTKAEVSNVSLADMGRASIEDGIRTVVSGPYEVTANLGDGGTATAANVDAKLETGRTRTIFVDVRGKSWVPQHIMVFPVLDREEFDKGVAEITETKEKIVKIKADTDDLWTDIDETWTSARRDGAISQDEMGAISKWVDENVRPDAESAVEAAKGYWKKVYEAATGAGMDDAQATSVADNAAANYPLKKTAEELKSLSGQLNELLAQIYSEGNSATEAELQQVEVLMGKIRDLQTELGILKDESVQYAANAVTVVKAGYGTSRELGIATAYIEQQYAMEKENLEAEVARIGEQRTNDIAALAEMLNSDQITQAQFDTAAQSIADNYTSALADLNAQIEQLNVDRLRELNELSVGFATQTTTDGVKSTSAQVESAAAELEKWLDIAEKFGGIELEVGDTEGFTSAVDTIQANVQTLSEVLPELSTLWGMEKAGGGQYTLEDFLGIGTDNFDFSSLTLSQVQDIVQQVKDQVSEHLVSATTDTENNPISQYLTAMLANAEVEEADMAYANGPLATAMKTQLLSQSGIGAVASDEYKEIGSKVGTDVTTGYTDSLKEGAADAQEAGKALGEAGTAGVAEGAETQSPSKATIETGKYVAEGLKQGIEEGTGDAEAAAKKMGQSAATATATGASDPMQRSAMSRAGQALMQGLAEGIRAGQYLAVNAAADAARATVTKMRDSLKIHSPSRVFEELGEYTMLGFAGGIEGQTRASLNAIQSASRQMTQAVTGNTYNTHSTANTYNDTVNNNFGDMYIRENVDVDLLIHQMNRKSRRSITGRGALA